MKNIILIFILLTIYADQIKGQSVKIDDIKNSTLLVKLTTNEHLINHHINNGDFQKAEAVSQNLLCLLCHGEHQRLPPKIQ